jgi:hypothetical protein
MIMQDARNKITGLIRQAIENNGFELVTSPGKPTRDGYPLTHMYAQAGTATRLGIDAAWFGSSASFELYGPAVEQADPEFFTSRKLYRGLSGSRGIRRLHCSILVPFSDGARIDTLLGATQDLLTPAGSSGQENRS